MNPIHRRYIDARRAVESHMCEETLSELRLAMDAVTTEARREKPQNCGYCKDCKWWSHWIVRRVAYERGDCTRFEHKSSQFVSDETPAFVNLDRVDEGYAEFATRPDFGCVQFEAKQG